MPMPMLKNNMCLRRQLSLEVHDMEGDDDTQGLLRRASSTRRSGHPGQGNAGDLSEVFKSPLPRQPLPQGRLVRMCAALRALGYQLCVSQEAWLAGSNLYMVHASRGR